MATTMMPDDKPSVTLKPGDPAPQLKASKWLQGTEINAFEPGKVYVVEFWAVWCGPCISLMPHLARMQREFKDQGVLVIGFTAGDPKNTADHVTKFVARRGPKLGYTFAFGADRSMWEAWMTAAGRGGIPCTYVVDKTGRIAYIGDPTFLPIVLPKVVAGVPALEVSKDAADVLKEFSDTISAPAAADPKEALKALKAFEARYPALVDCLQSAKLKLSFLPKHGEPGEAKKYAAALIERAMRENDPLNLKLASGILRLGDGKEDKELLAMAVKAALAEVQMSDEQDFGVLLNLAECCFAAGDQGQAKVWGQKALAAASGASTAQIESIKKQLKRFETGD
jgi:thiol-disulfide isomerase/thioredoxin